MITRSVHSINETKIVQDHVKNNANLTFQPSSGVLKYPYLIPGGYYQQSWDWDSMFLGIALRDYGVTPYFIGTFMNFLAAVNLTDGEVPGCMTPSGASPALYHAKPILIQAAYLAAKQKGDLTIFSEFAPQMRAVLMYWNSSTRLDAATGLHMWHDQLESGADNLVYSECPSQYSPECWSDSQAFTLSSPDIMVWMIREYTAYANFVDAWGNVSTGGCLYSCVDWRVERDTAMAYARNLKDVLNDKLWHWEDVQMTHGYYVGFNVSTGQQILNRTYQAAWPVWQSLAPNSSVTTAALRSLQEPDLWNVPSVGLRSTSSRDPRFNNENIVNPYSNWRGES
jgi:alpha,alpha-trehalase